MLSVTFTVTSRTEGPTLHAHEVLSDSAIKADYDNMLRNPQNYYTNSMRFYKQKMKKMKPTV
jgi:hypothetical protein